MGHQQVRDHARQPAQGVGDKADGRADAAGKRFDKAAAPLRPQFHQRHEHSSDEGHHRHHRLHHAPHRRDEARHALRQRLHACLGLRAVQRQQQHAQRLAQSLKERCPDDAGRIPHPVLQVREHTAEGHGLRFHQPAVLPLQDGEERSHCFVFVADELARFAELNAHCGKLVTGDGT